MTKTFHDLNVDAALCDALEKHGITHPFAIQELTLPLALEGNDLIGQARTGTGKTLAFGLPLLQRIDPSKKVTQALVIAPTRELANQVHEDLTIGSTLGLKSVTVYGGTPYEEQIEALTSGVHVVVGTPGRLLDHLNRGNLDLSHVTELVLDEADEMLDMGFLPDVERLIEACQGPSRHTMLFSATMPTAIVKLARRYMDHPTFTRADHEEKNTAPLVEQHFFQVHRMDKPRILARILQSPGRGGVYVFVRTKHMADRLVNDLEELGTPAIPIHGDLRQTAREKNLDRFRSGKATVLVATEVAARGLDVLGVTHVVNYDCPDDEKMYLHRIGRTARAGEAGVAITFAEFNEADRLNVIRKAVGATDTDVMQVFSTSPELTALFDLPPERPWDAMVKEQTNDGRGGRTGSGPSESSRGDGGGRPSGGRSGRSDGRSKNERSNQGRARDTGRHTSRRDVAGTISTDTAAATTRSDSDREVAPKGEADRGTERVRTRSRTRNRDTSERGEHGDGEDATQGRGGSERDSGGGSRGEDDQRHQGDRSSQQDRSSGGTKGSGRVRARRGAASGGPRAEKGTETQDASSTSGRSGGRGGSEAAEHRSGGDRGRGRDSNPKSNRSRSSDEANGNGRGGTRGDSGNKNKGGGNRSGSRGGRSDRREDSSSHQDASEPTAALERRGPGARGEGQPQTSRRVKVEHLP